jgi:glycosyltransferase involved in cell wall biosynthesis
MKNVLTVPWSAKRFLSEKFLDCCQSYVRSSLRDRRAPRSFERICIVAALRKNSGIAQGAHLQYDSMRRTGADVELLDATDALRNPLFRIKHRPATAYIFHSGGPQIASLLTSVLPEAKHAYRIAYWAWELPGSPKRWPEPNGLVSEIWTPSTYSQRSLSMGFRIPIHVVTHVVALDEQTAPKKKSKPFSVLVMADSRSSLQRKNPAAAVAAFIKAFGDSDSARLTIKINGSAANFCDVLKPLNQMNNVTVIDDFLDDEGMRDLYNSASVLISLHRGEGFGLPMLEAMSLGVPVVATGWSGNLDFMNQSNSLLIRSKQIPVCDPTLYSRYAESTWADPDVDEAADALRRLAVDEDLYESISGAGRKTAQDLLNSWRLPS